MHTSIPDTNDIKNNLHIKINTKRAKSIFFSIEPAMSETPQRLGCFSYVLGCPIIFPLVVCCDLSFSNPDKV